MIGPGLRKVTCGLISWVIAQPVNITMAQKRATAYLPKHIFIEYDLYDIENELFNTMGLSILSRIKAEMTITYHEIH
jgi:hypothetical protein